MKLSKFLLTEITAEILLHPESGVGFELLENTYIVDENVIEVKMHQPVTININPGPFHGEMLTRVQTVLSKTIESEGHCIQNVSSMKKKFVDFSITMVQSLNHSPNQIKALSQFKIFLNRQ